MGKTLVYLVLLCFLGFGVYYFLYRNKEGLYQETEANFTFKDTAAIGKIFLVENDGSSILVQRGTTENWVVNNTYPAMRVQIRNILTCLRLQTALIPVGHQEHDRVVKLLAGLGTKVEVYDRKGNKMRSFFVAGQGPNFHGSYMILEGAATPYLVEIQGFDGYLSPRFNTDINEWRSRLIFATPADSIRSIQLQYPEEPAKSFTLRAQNGNYSILGQDNKVHTQLHPKRIKDYLSFFSNVNGEGYINGLDDLDSTIQHSRLRCHITLTTLAGATTMVDVYWKDLDAKEMNMIDQTTTDPTHRPSNVMRLYAVLHSTADTMMIQALSFEKILRSGPDFYTP